MIGTARSAPAMVAGGSASTNGCGGLLKSGTRNERLVCWTSAALCALSAWGKGVAACGAEWILSAGCSCTSSQRNQLCDVRNRSHMPANATSQTVSRSATAPSWARSAKPCRDHRRRVGCRIRERKGIAVCFWKRAEQGSTARYHLLPALYALRPTLIHGTVLFAGGRWT